MIENQAGRMNVRTIIGTIFLLWQITALSIEVDNKSIAYLESFAKVYGYVKYFCPSDEAADTDWDRFAIYGVEVISKVESEEMLKTELERLFSPVAPEIQFYRTGDNIPHPQTNLNKIGLRPIYWQHLGLGGKDSNIYTSIRVGRTNQEVKPEATLRQNLDVTLYRNKQFRFTAWTKSNNETTPKLFIVEVDDDNGERIFTQNLSVQEDSNGLSKTVITGMFSAFSKEIYIGLSVKDKASASIDLVELAVKQGNRSWRNLDIKNPSFEDWKKGKPIGWMLYSKSFQLVRNTQDSRYGNMSAELTPLSTGEKVLFNSKPKRSDFVVRRISANLSFKMPLVVFGDDKNTYPISKTQADNLNIKLSSVDKNLASQYREIADIIVLWNTIQHFYPYLDEVKNKWQHILRGSLALVQKKRSEDEIEDILGYMIEAIGDGHAKVINPKFVLPLLFSLIDTNIVVLKSLDNRFHPGDIVKTINSAPVMDTLHDNMLRISGSKQWKINRSLERLRINTSRTMGKITVVQSGQERTFEVRYGTNYKISVDLIEKTTDLGDGIFYVDLDRTNKEDIQKHMQEIANARGVIFDLRGYPKNNSFILNHFVDTDNIPLNWMKVANTIYPDQENQEYTERGWNLLNSRPRLSGKVIFLADSNAISQAESVLGIVKYTKSALIIGEKSAGANGNVNHVILPGGDHMFFTGMIVTNLDGTRHRRLGVIPDIQISQDLKSIKNGKDLILAKAIQILNDQDRSASDQLDVKLESDFRF